MEDIINMASNSIVPRMTMDEANSFLNTSKAEYIKNGGGLCPFCKKPDIETLDVFFTDNEGDYLHFREGRGDKVHITKMCNECMYKWTDIYKMKLVNIRAN